MDIMYFEKYITKIIPYIVHKRRQTQMKKTLYKREYISQTACLATAQSMHVKIDNISLCGKCYKNIGSSVFVLDPEMKKYHYACFYETNNNNIVAANDTNPFVNPFASHNDMNPFGDQNDKVSETANPFDNSRNPFAMNVHNNNTPTNQFGNQIDITNPLNATNAFGLNEQKRNTNTLHYTTQFENNDNKTQINPLNDSIQHDNDVNSLNINNLKTKESHDKTVLSPFDAANDVDSDAELPEILGDDDKSENSEEDDLFALEQLAWKPTRTQGKMVGIAVRRDTIIVGTDKRVVVVLRVDCDPQLFVIGKKGDEIYNLFVDSDTNHLIVTMKNGLNFYINLTST
eukprot:266470_1